MPDVDNNSRSLGDEVTIIRIIFSGCVGDASGCGGNDSASLTDDETKWVPNGATGFHRNSSLMTASTLRVQLHGEEERVKERNGGVSTSGVERSSGPFDV